jgi:nucleoside-specific outer membrane channel protein Tsx
MSYSINFHLYQEDDDPEDAWQAEHVFMVKFPYISDRLYFSGFADHTFNSTVPPGVPSNPIVGEAQLGFRLVENLYVMTEFRLNEYRVGNEQNQATGFEYKIKW